MASPTEIANMALGHLGQSFQIADLDTEQSNEANVMRLFYPIVRDAVLTERRWPFTEKIRDLSLITDEPEGDEWNYLYQYPSDCLSFWRILSGTTQDTIDSQVPYRIVANPNQTGLKAILTNEQNATGEYCRRSDDPTIYSPNFTLAVSFKLAFMIAPALTTGDPKNLRKSCFDLYAQTMSQAAAQAFNEQRLGPKPESEFIRVRNSD
jgi:hypothetical protein